MAVLLPEFGPIFLERGKIMRMKADLADVLKRALELPPEARAALATSLLDSLDSGIDENVEEEWEQEINRRIAELNAGTVVPWSEARRRLLERAYPSQTQAHPEAASYGWRSTSL